MDVVTDGTYLWVVDLGLWTDKVFKYTVSGSLVGSWSLGYASESPTGITLDPSDVSHLWVVDSGTDRVYQFDAAAGRTSGSQAPSMSFALAAGNTNPQGIADPPAGVPIPSASATTPHLPPPTTARGRLGPLNPAPTPSAVPPVSLAGFDQALDTLGRGPAEAGPAAVLPDLLRTRRRRVS